MTKKTDDDKAQGAQTPSTTSPPPVPPSLNLNEAEAEMFQTKMLGMVNNSISDRTQLISQLYGGTGKDLNTSCGYPTSINPENYAAMYAREGLAARVVDVWPEECWSEPPVVYEDEQPNKETEFEKAWGTLDKEHNVISLMSRVDMLSGIGRFGILLIGVDDGKALSEPIEGVPLDGTTTGGGTPKKLLYLRPFAESVIQVTTLEADSASPRFGLPVLYSITFNDGEHSFSAYVHWHRVLHFADGREMSEVYGTPRMQKSFNRLMDAQKILGGSGEMFWKGAFPGLSFETTGEDPELDVDSVRKEMTAYMNGLQRYLAFKNITTKSLAPQAVSPVDHLQAQLDAIAIGEGIPKRILFGSERGELASSQDAKAWNRRLGKRQHGYITPFIIRIVVDRFLMLGILPWVEVYFVRWPDLNTQTDQERADVAKAWAEALSKYVAGDVDSAVPLAEFLSIFADLPLEQITQIQDAVDSLLREEDELGAEEEPEEEEEEE